MNNRQGLWLGPGKTRKELQVLWTRATSLRAGIEPHQSFEFENSEEENLLGLYFFGNLFQSIFIRYLRSYRGNILILDRLVDFVAID